MSIGTVFMSFLYHARVSSVNTKDINEYYRYKETNQKVSWRIWIFYECLDFLYLFISK